MFGVEDEVGLLLGCHFCQLFSAGGYDTAVYGMVCCSRGEGSEGE